MRFSPFSRYFPILDRTIIKFEYPIGLKRFKSGYKLPTDGFGHAFSWFLYYMPHVGCWPTCPCWPISWHASCRLLAKIEVWHVPCRLVCQPASWHVPCGLTSQYFGPMYSLPETSRHWGRTCTMSLKHVDHPVKMPLTADNQLYGANVSMLAGRIDNQPTCLLSADRLPSWPDMLPFIWCASLTCQLGDMTMANVYPHQCIQPTSLTSVIILAFARIFLMSSCKGFFHVILQGYFPLSSSKAISGNYFDTPMWGWCFMVDITSLAMCPELSYKHCLTAWEISHWNEDVNA